MIYEKPRWRNTSILRRGSVTACGRRSFLSMLGGFFVLSWLRPCVVAAAVPDKLIPLIQEVAGSDGAKPGKIKLVLPPLAESGNSVPLRIQVESLMTADNYVKSIHVFSERNPRSVIARFYLSPLNG